MEERRFIEASQHYANQEIKCLVELLSPPQSSPCLLYLGQACEALAFSFWTMKFPPPPPQPNWNQYRKQFEAVHMVDHNANALCHFVLTSKSLTSRSLSHRSQSATSNASVFAALHLMRIYGSNKPQKALRVPISLDHRAFAQPSAWPSPQLC